MNPKLNKKAEEKIITIWWFICLILVGTAIVIVVLGYFGTFVDIRDAEISMLQEKIMDCITQDAYLIEEILFLDSKEILKRCNLNPKQFQDQTKFLIDITIYNQTKDMNLTIKEGNRAYYKDCLATANVKTINYPKCIISNESIIYFNRKTAKKEFWTISLIIASNNLGEKISLSKKDGKL